MAENGKLVRDRIKKKNERYIESIYQLELFGRGL